MPAGTLRGILSPVLPGNDDACDDQGDEQHHEQIFPGSERIVVVGVPDQEVQEIGDWIRHKVHLSSLRHP
jgi:hypothetical protein